MPIPTANSPADAGRVMLRDVVHDKIRDAIMDGTLQPGERLSDDELGRWLGVSRTPLREALNELTRAGLVEMAPNRYTRVANPTAEQAIEALQTLGVILGGVVRLAVPHINDMQREEILANIDIAVAASRAEDQENMYLVLQRLFNHYVDRCGNEALIRLCRDSIDGLAFKLHVVRLHTVVDFPILTESLTSLREATIAEDPIAAELATQALHLLPGTPLAS